MPRDTADRLAIRGVDRELGALARRPHVGSLPHRLAQGRADVGDLVSGLLRGIHPRQPGRLRPRRAHHAHARRHEHRHQRQARDRANQDDDLAARQGRGRAVRRRVQRPLLRFSGKAQRPLGHRAAAARLRKRPHRSGRARCEAHARQDASGAVSGRLPPPRLSAEQDRLHGQGRPARPRRAAARQRSTPRARPGSRARKL